MFEIIKEIKNDDCYLSSDAVDYEPTFSIRPNDSKNVDIYIFEYHGNHSYSIETSKGVLNGQFTSRSFISAFAKILSLNSTGNDRGVFIFVLYMDGSFERRSNSPVIAKF